MAQQQWAPYTWMPFNQNPQAMQNQLTGQAGGQPVFMLSPPIMSPMMVMSPTPNDQLLSAQQRPHSVAYGAPPPHVYPFVNFNWQQQHHQQQQPDVTAQEHHVSGLLFSPDLVAATHAGQQQPEQPTYANDGESGDNLQPCYMNTGARVDRGKSMPPVLDSTEWGPKPPPRSKRSSRLGSRSSLAGSTTNSVDAKDLTQRLQKLETQPIAQQPHPPIRPPRRKKGRNSALKPSATLPRDFLHSIAEYDTSPNPNKEASKDKKADHEEPKPVIPQPGGPTLSKSTDEQPQVPMPTGSSLGSRTQEMATVPMPTEKPSIPQPDGLVVQSDGKFEKAYFSVTLPMPSNHGKRRESSTGPKLDRAASMQSIRNEIIDGLQKIGANVNVLKQGVVKIYEDLKPVIPMPTYASPCKTSKLEKDKVIAEPLKAKTEVEDPYESVSFQAEDESVSQHSDEGIEDDEENVKIVQSILADNVEKAFRATFFGIEPDDEDDDVRMDDLDHEHSKADHEENESEEETDGDITPTGEDLFADEKEQLQKELPKEPINRQGTESESETEEVLSDTETIDVSMDQEPQYEAATPEEMVKEQYNELMYKAVGTTWDEVDLEDTGGLPPALALHANIHSLKLDLLSSIFQGLYPTEEDCVLVRNFLSCPASLEEKYAMIRLSDLLKKNKRAGIELEDIAEAMSQLAKIGSELLRPEDDRDPLWRSIPVAKEITISKGIATRAPWESIQVRKPYQ